MFLNPNRLGGTDSRPKKTSRRRWLWAALIILSLSITISIVILLCLHPALITSLRGLYELLTDRQRITAFVNTFGAAAPLAFIVLQLIQVIVAPIPGEATGFIGGYLFGALRGTLYSTLALTLGSYVNFIIGRILGKKWVRKVIPPVRFAKMDYLLRRQGILLIFFLFLFPGFPKDYLCLFVGISTIPLRVFLLMAFIGRLPGTLMLNLQGALVFGKNYHILFVLIALYLIVLILGFYFRNRLYLWVEKFNGRSKDKIDEGTK